jgi:hypothetical protein|tara:strand:+ start:6597 stop:6794 length:198 start_codon:yes stop_codon:yes gene_type:complete
MRKLSITDAEIAILEMLYMTWKNNESSKKKPDMLKNMEISYTICAALPKLLDEIKSLRAKVSNND